jgi:ATP-dependent DNA helicase DinG
MAEIVEGTLGASGRAFSFIEAPTGTGKSFAYLIPALESGQRVVISTAKKALQEQLYVKDLPFLLSRLGLTTSVAMLKGKGNYLCQARLEGLHDTAPGFEEVVKWASTTELGDLSEIPIHPAVLPQIRVQECAKDDCDFAGQCGYLRAKERGGEAQILVVNHALLAQDLALGGKKLLGAYSAVILDEAHQAPEAFREAFSVRLQSRYASLIGRAIEGTLGKTPVTNLANAFNALFRLFNGEMTVPWTASQMLALSNVYSVLAGIKANYAEQNTQRGKERSGVLSFMGKLLDGMDKVLKQEDNYFSYTAFAQDKLELVISPIEVGPLVRPALLNIGKGVFTSATLSATGPNPFAYIEREFGVGGEDIKAEEALPSPFDYAKVSALYIPAMPPVNDKRAFLDAAVLECHDMLVASKGGAFILCASYEDMRFLGQELGIKSGDLYRVKTQDEGLDNALAWFRSTPSSVLLGVKTLWEGVDVEGLGLRLVIIPRLPFPRQDDLLLSARKAGPVARMIENGKTQLQADLKAWSDFDLQAASIALQQGSGRLIRGPNDFGVVAVLDSRLAGNNKKYSAALRRKLPHPVNSDKVAVLKFLSTLAQVAAKRGV